MKVTIGSDHAGYHLKSELARELTCAGHEVTDLGTHGTEAVDYPDYAQAVGEAVAAGEADRGVLVCGSAVGVGVAANKIPGIRAGVCHDTYSAHQAVEHDDINVLCLGERVIGPALACEVLHSFMRARFTGEERHVRRLEKVTAIEKKYSA
jgi:ribose 5-phosphate isomerase B